VAVIGAADPTWGERVTACAVLRAGATLTLDELKDFARERLAPYKIPRSLRLLPALPRNAMGKVQKKVLMQPGADET
jgi:acyl-CoA synthetase (AMP-forming)/AMP-acid ligase II